MRTLTFVYRWPGLVEAIAEHPHDEREEIESEGYQDSGIYDLQVEIDPQDNQPYCFMSSNFEQNYPIVIWGAKTKFNQERFDLPQAQLHDVPLHVAFSWAYYHFILEDNQKQLPNRELVIQLDPNNMTQQVLAHAVQTMGLLS
ncbi:hypothetical protein QUF58_07675 [Anaerolineales bacterium HSG24]|nr:hypothetical protein [Anaerolineales bacterium HSG24]